MIQRNKISYQISKSCALTPLDGRNHHKLTSLTPFFSEQALNKYRILVEITYLNYLAEYQVIRRLTNREKKILDHLTQFSDKDYQVLRQIELATNHDVKAVEQFIQRKLLKTSLKDITEMVHFGLTADDTNNLAYALMIKGALQQVIIPEIEKNLKVLKDKAMSYKYIPMLGRTHGQPAVPTTLGKEFLVYYSRLKQELEILKNQQIKAKLTGNVGNLNAHKFIFADINWLKFSQELVSFLGLEPDLITTQIEPYDSYIRIFDALSRINHLLIGLCQDMWFYISQSYFKQRVINEEVGSTALPHKVNPIYFEGAEGGFGIANALFEFYRQKLSYSRMQRDLSDSTIRRSFGIAFAYSLLSYQSGIEGLKRIEPNEKNITNDLNQHWQVLSEAIQNYLRVKGIKQGYEKAKKFFRGKERSSKEIDKFISELKLPAGDKQKLLQLKPENYTGYAGKLVEKYLK